MYARKLTKFTKIAQFTAPLSYITNPLQHGVIRPQQRSLNTHPLRNPFYVDVSGLTTAELEQELAKLDPSKRNVAQAIVRKLFRQYVLAGQWQRALEMKTRCDELGVQQSEGYLRTIYLFYVALKDFTKAEQTLDELLFKFPDYTITGSSFIQFAGHLVRCGKYDKLNDLIESHLEVSSDYFADDAVAELLQQTAQHYTYANAAVATTPVVNHSHKLFNLLYTCGYCEPREHVLAPIVRERLLNADIRAAVTDFITLSKTHKQTPLAVELLSLLLSLSNDCATAMQRYAPFTVAEARKLLGQATAVIEQVRGKPQMNNFLLAALAKTGHDEQIRKHLLQPEYRYDEQHLTELCLELALNNELDTLWRMLRALRAVPSTENFAVELHGRIFDALMKVNRRQTVTDLYSDLKANNDQEAVKLPEDLESRINKFLGQS